MDLNHEVIAEALRLMRKGQMALFQAPTTVSGHVQGGRFIAPYSSHRRRRAEAPTPAKPVKAVEHAVVQPHPTENAPLTGDALIEAALKELASRLRTPGMALDNPSAVKDFLRMKLASSSHEIFAAIYLDSAHRMLSYEELSHGTLNAANVYPREVVKSALKHGAASVIFAHNHPSGVSEPSVADRRLTDRLKDALGLVDIRVVDHLIVGGDTNMRVTSFAERGWV